MERRKIQDIKLPSKADKRHDAPMKKTVKQTRTVVKNSQISRTKNSVKKRLPNASRSPARARRLHTSHSPLVAGVHKREGKGTAALWGITFVLVLVLVYVVSTTFSQATVLVSLREQVIPVETTLELYRDGVQDKLDFDSVTFSVDATEPLADVSVDEVAEKSAGMVTIFNNYSTQPQRLVEETRLEATNGLVYKLGKGAGITIPGQTEQNGELLPGSVDVMVYASEPGPKYNQAATDFVIPGFRGGPKFEGFYARSTSDLTGGYIGNRPVLPDTDSQVLAATIEAQLDTKLRNELPYRIPEGYLPLSENPLSVTTGDVSYQETDTGEFNAQQQVKVTWLITKKEELSHGILNDIASKEESNVFTSDDQVSVINLEDLSYQIMDTSNEQMVTLLVVGDARIQWSIEDVVVKRIIAGIKKKDFTKVLQARSEIQSARAEVRPNWVRSLPKKFDRINVIFRNIDTDQ